MFGFTGVFFIIISCVFSLIFIVAFTFIVIAMVKNIKKAQQQHLEQMSEDGDKEKGNDSKAQEHKGGKVVICPYCKTKNGANESECKNCGAIL